jgi:hypothetical protein
MVQDEASLVWGFAMLGHVVVSFLELVAINRDGSYKSPVPHREGLNREQALGWTFAKS